MATRKHKIQTTFAGGVLSENAFGRIDVSLYDNGLKQGENIIIENPGGATRRPGTLFVREFTEDYVRLLPFSFNTEQTYLLAFTELKIDVYRDNTLVASVVSPYTNQQIKELDFAQSADSMVLTQGDIATQIFRRLGSDADWELVPAPFVSPPTELRCDDGNKPGAGGVCDDASTPTEQNQWDDINGYPKYCTFFQGRLYLAACNLLPQHVWGSQVHDFFNFDLGTGEDNEAIYDILDTDFINPIVGIYAEKKLYVFSTGDEFVNNAAVITPAASAWQRASKYGSFGTVRPVAFDAGVIFLDRSGRTIRQMIFEDGIKAFDSAAVSMFSEHLIKAPINMGVMKGRLFQASNFLYLVNVDGTLAVLNLSRAAGMAAWTIWKTQGAFKDILTFNNEITYVLVERRGKWILEQLMDGIYIDSGSTVTTPVEVLIPEPVTYNTEVVTNISETVTYGFETSALNSDAVIGDDNNFFGISFDKRGYGRVVIVAGGVEVYKNTDFIQEPLKPNDQLGTIFTPVNRFAYNEDLEDLYFDEVKQTEFYQYSMIVITESDASQNFIPGLPHLIGREVVMNLDGSVFHEQTVIPGDQLPGGGLLKAYPDGIDWLFDETVGNETYIIRYVDADLVTTLVEGYYAGTKYGPLTENEFWNAYPITQSGEPVADDEFLEEGVFVKSTSYAQTILVTSGTYLPPTGVSEISACIVGGGGSGSRQILGAINGGGFAGEVKSFNFTIPEGFGASYQIGAGGSPTPPDSNSYGFSGNPSNIAGISAAGGAGGKYDDGGLYNGTGASRTTCGGTGNDGNISSTNRGGQSSGFGNGGNGGIDTAPGLTGGVGSGGGGSKQGVSGAGGRGQINVTPQGTRRFYRIRKMKLITAAVPLTDGVVETPRTFKQGQAGLWFGVEMETLPLDAASVTNEPKRIVSIMPRFVNTAGLNIANNEVPERRFGTEVLDAPPPKKTGIQKIRLLGYSRETTVRITQYDPLPMTLVSLDIEINIG